MFLTNLEFVKDIIIISTMNKLSEYIVENTDIVDIISRRVQLKRAGSNFSGLSPFQHEKTPSFMVSPQKQIFKDFSSWIGGNVITFVMEYEKVDYMDAIRIIADEQRLDISEYVNNSEKAKEYWDEKEKLKRIHKLTQNFFVDQLHKSEKAQKYLHENRKLSNSIIEQFWIWYAPDSSYELLQYLKEKWFNEQDLVQASLAKKWQSDYFSFFRNRITFPIFDTRDNIVWFSARVINPEDQPKYLNSSEQAIFEKSKILYWLNFAKNNVKIFDMIILVEWQMDVIWLYKLWYPVWVATCWTAATEWHFAIFEEPHFKILKRYTDNMYIFYDNDDAWKNATIRVLTIAYRKNIFPKMIVLPDGIKDAGELSDLPNWKEIFEWCIKNAKDAFIQVYELLREKYDMSSPIDKQKLFNDMFSLIICVDNYTIQEHYKHLLAEKVWLPYEILSEQFKKYKRTDWKFELAKKWNTKTTPSWQPDREKICASLFRDTEIFNKYISDPNLYKNLIEFSRTVWENLKDDLLNKIFTNREEIPPEEKLQLDELQLWREKELAALSWDEKRIQLIKKLSLEQLHTKLKLILKSTTVPTDIKQQLLVDIKKI